MSEHFYHMNKILTMLDINGVLPWLLFVVGNKTAGKTFSVKYFLINRHKRRHEEFIIFVRRKNRMKGKIEGFFDSDVGPIKFPKHKMSQRPILDGAFYRIYFDGRPCGFIVPISNVDIVKENSSLFSNVTWGFFDEFQSESGIYCANEAHNFWSIVIAIARGGKSGKHVRDFRVIMCSNNVTLYNPYYEYFHISGRLKPDTHFLRGDGWCLEQTLNAEAEAAIRKKFRGVGEKELSYAASNDYMMDTNTFLDPANGQKKCLCLIKLRGRRFSVWGMEKNGLWLVSSKRMGSSRYMFAAEVSDHEPGTTLLTRSSDAFKVLRKAWQSGRMRFDSGAAKAAWLEILDNAK